jgi:hypothetical protein
LSLGDFQRFSFSRGLFADCEILGLGRRSVTVWLFMPEILDSVLVAVIAAAAVAGARALWKRRRGPIHWFEAGKDATARRRQRTEHASHRELVSWVLQRADVLKIDVPVGVTRSSRYDTVEYHPSGRHSYFVSDFQTYQSLLRSGQLPPRQTFWKASTPRPLNRWTEVALREWLKAHAGRAPATAPR